MNTHLRRASFILSLAVILIISLSSLPNTVPAYADAPGGDIPLAAAAQLTPSGSPIQADDEHFIADTGGDLDLYLFRTDRPDGKLKFSIPITRYYFTHGDTTNFKFDGNGFMTSNTVNYVKSKKFLPDTVRLSMRVFDVDEDAAPCPEVDLIWINGNLLSINGRNARLSGANDVWSEVSFDVPIEMLKFPQSKGSNMSAPTPALNEIAIQIDATPCDPAGPYWAVAVDYGILTIQGPIRPVLFVHGWTGTTNTFAYISDKLKEDGIPTAGTPDLQEGIYPIAETANWLAIFIDQATNEFGVKKVNLFSHSKGGLVARQAALIPAVSRKVQTVLTFDTPNHGTTWAENDSAMKILCSKIKYPSDATKANLCYQATKEFTIDAVRDNYNYNNCKYNFFTGWSGCELKYDGSRSPIRYRAFAAIGSPVVVPKSTTAYPWDADKAPFPSWLIDLSVLDGKYFTTHGGILSRDDAYQCAIHILDGSRYSCPSSNRPGGSWAKELDLTTASAATTADQLIFSEGGSLAAPGSYSNNLTVDSATQLAFYAISENPAGFSLQEQGGRIINPALAATDPLIEYQASQELGMNVYTYVIDNPVSGTWQVSLQSATANDFAISALLDSAVTLELAVDNKTYLPGDTIKAEAALVQSGSALTGGTFSGEFEQPGGSYASLMFYDDGTNGDSTPGDGIFTAQTIAPVTQANLFLRVSADQGLIHREASRLLEISSQTATLASVSSEWTVDEDGDGLIDWLMLQVDYNTLASGHFDLQGALVTSGGTLIESVAATSRSQSVSPLAPGLHSAILQFSGETIFNAGANGPYKLTDLYLSDSTNQLFQVDSAVDFYTTAAYARNQFEHPLLWLQSASHTVADTNANGRYDNLTFHLNVGIVPVGSYTISGRIVDPNGEEIAWSSTNFSTFGEAVYTANLVFDGSTIGESALDGPYTLLDVNLYNQQGTASMSFGEVASTGAYRFTQFENGYYRAYLPATLKQYNKTTLLTMSGQVKDGAGPAPNEMVYLEKYDGQSWDIIDTVLTDSSGHYEFKDLTPPKYGQYMDIGWNNSTGNPNRLAYFYCYTITSTYNLPLYECDLDISGITLLNPANGANISLPYSFTWVKRNNPADNYEVDLTDPNDFDPYYWTPLLGYVNSYTMNSIPAGFSINTPYVWFIWVLTDDGYGQSYHWNQFTFANTGAQIQNPFSGEVETRQAPGKLRLHQPALLPPALK